MEPDNKNEKNYVAFKEIAEEEETRTLERLIEKEKNY